MAKVRNYINNKTLYTSMIEHRNKLKISIENNKLKPQVSNYIGQSILLICNNLAKKPNFSGYTYKQEMISDGIIDCIAAVDNFDPDKTNNPFAYFTQIAWNAFIRRITKEKKQSYIKHKNFEHTNLLDDLNNPSLSLMQLGQIHRFFLMQTNNLYHQKRLDSKQKLRLLISWCSSSI